MAANLDPIFITIPVLKTTVSSAANAARDGSGTITSFLTGGTNGTQLFRVVARSGQATAAASTAKVVILWISTDNGATWHIFDEAVFATATASTTAIGQTVSFEYAGGKLLPSAARLGVTQTVYGGVQDRLEVRAEAGDY